MTEEGTGELYTRLAFQHESTLDALIAKRFIDQELADGAREKFYTSLNEKSRGHTRRLEAIPRSFVTI